MGDGLKFSHHLGNSAHMNEEPAKPGLRGERMLFTNTTLSKE